MADVIIVGDGPAGLSAALFLARGGHEATVYGQDKTAMHYADLHNYLGVEADPGPDFQARARAQVEAAGARLHDAEVLEVATDGDRVSVVLDDGTSAQADYLLLAAGKTGTKLARQLGLEPEASGLEVDANQRTAHERVYAAGRLVRPNRSQAVISVGAGAVAALDILAREAGQDVTDWDELSTD